MLKKWKNPMGRSSTNDKKKKKKTRVSKRSLRKRHFATKCPSKMRKKNVRRSCKSLKVI